MQTEYKRAVGVFVFNDKGELALQLRARGDDSLPDHWDISAAGTINDGEKDMRASAERELREELGVMAEVEKVDFFSLDEIQKMIDSRDKFHPEFVLLWNKRIKSFLL